MLAELQQINSGREFRVSPDPETQFIFDQRPQVLLEQLFQNDPGNVFLLKGSGFSMDGQLESWINGYKNALDKNESLEKVRHLLIQKTIQDVIGFYYEYLSKQDIFPINVEFQIDENNQRVVYAPKYSETLESVTLPDERGGALIEGVKKAVEIMINSDPETIVILNSPKGWSGLTREGKEIVYPDNQSYVYWINSEGNLEALTIRTNIDLETSEKLVGINKDKGSIKDRLKTVVSNPISKKINGFEGVLDLIEQISGQTFDKIRTEIRNKDTLFTLNSDAQKIIDNLTSFLNENITHLSLQNIKILAKEVGKAVLDLAKQTLTEEKPKSYYSNRYQGIHPHNFYNDGLDQYRALAQKVREIPGCNGGGTTESQAMSSVNNIKQIAIESNGKICRICGTSDGVACGWCKPCWKRHGKRS
ncbi:MAG TPA: hypothetical protein VKC53_03710 [Patescibacteria group bacterium]|nr:hypothetical protein [Patescibacteria group bacterium]